MKISRVGRSFLAVAAMALVTSRMAQGQTWNGSLDNQWNNAGNWSPASVPNAAGATATLTVSGGNAGTPLTVDVGSMGATVGILNIGTSDGVTGGTYTLQGTGGGTLTLNNSGSGAQINEISTAVGDTISTPLVLADAGGLTITDAATSTSAVFNLNGGITGTSDVLIVNNSGNTGNTLLTANNTGAAINNAGAFSVSGSGTGTVRIQGGIGSNVTSVTNASTGGTGLQFAGQDITMNSAGVTVSTTGTGRIFSDGNVAWNGTGTLTVDANGSGNLQLGTINTPTLVANGTYDNGGNDGQSGVNGNLTSTVTQVIQESAVNTFALRGNEAVSGDVTFQNTGGGAGTAGALLDNYMTITGTGNLILQNNSSTDGGITFSQNSINMTGTVTNNGTGTGKTEITETLGANVTSVIENSSTSGLEFRGIGSSYTGPLTVQSGQMIFSGGNSNFQSEQVVVGDTSAHGAGSSVKLNIDGGHWTTGGSQTISGFGTITGQPIVTSSGTLIAPGSVGHIGTLTIDNALTVVSGAGLKFVLGTAGGTPGTGLGSLLQVNGTLDLSTAMSLVLVDNAGADGLGSLGAGSYELINYNALTGTANTDLTSLFNITAPAGYEYTITNTNLSGSGEIDLQVTQTSVPEPGTWAMLLGGFGLVLGWRRVKFARI